MGECIIYHNGTPHLYFIRQAGRSGVMRINHNYHGCEGWVASLTAHGPVRLLCLLQLKPRGFSVSSLFSFVVIFDLMGQMGGWGSNSMDWNWRFDLCAGAAIYFDVVSWHMEDEIQYDLSINKQEWKLKKKGFLLGTSKAQSVRTAY